MRIRLYSEKRTGGTTLADLMIGLVLSSMLLAMTGSLGLYASRSLAAMGNYREQDAKRGNGLHLRSRNLRPAPQVTAFQNSSNIKCLVYADSPICGKPETSRINEAIVFIP